MLIRWPTEANRLAWDRRYVGYADFYRVAQTQEMRNRVWRWIYNPDHTTEALVADHDGQLVGLAHFRPFARPLAASICGYLGNLFVDPSARGSGAADRLTEA